MIVATLIHLILFSLSFSIRKKLFREDKERCTEEDSYPPRKTNAKWKPEMQEKHIKRAKIVNVLVYS